MSAVYSIFTSPTHPPVLDHLPTLIVTPHGKPAHVLYTYLHTNQNRENYLLTPSDAGDLCVAKLFPPPTHRSTSSTASHSQSSSSSSSNAVKCEASRNLRWSITNTGIQNPVYKALLDQDGMEQPLFQVSKPNPNATWWTLFYFTYAGHLIPPKRVEFGRIQKNSQESGGGTRVAITGKSEEEKAVWKTLGDGNEDMVEWIVLCAALTALDDEIILAAEKSGLTLSAGPASSTSSHSSRPQPSIPIQQPQRYAPPPVQIAPPPAPPQQQRPPPPPQQRPPPPPLQQQRLPPPPQQQRPPPPLQAQPQPPSPLRPSSNPRARSRSPRPPPVMIPTSASAPPQQMYNSNNSYQQQQSQYEGITGYLTSPTTSTTVASTSNSSYQPPPPPPSSYQPNNLQYASDPRYQLPLQPQPQWHNNDPRYPSQSQDPRYAPPSQQYPSSSSSQQHQQQYYQTQPQRLPSPGPQAQQNGNAVGRQPSSYRPGPPSQNPQLYYQPPPPQQQQQPQQIQQPPSAASRILRRQIDEKRVLMGGG